MINTDFNYNECLHIELITNRNFNETQTLLKTVTLWGDSAQRKACLATKDSEEQILFSQAESIYNCISLDLTMYTASKKHFHKSPLLEIWLCKDSQGNLQGIMKISEKKYGIHVHYLATHPNNLRLSLNKQEPNRVFGVGSLLLSKAKQIAEERGKKEVDLQAISTSVEFYEKQGFTEEDSKKNWMVYKIDSLSQEKLKPAA
jgi:GNAT superfamily N-acetyltransferase